MSESRGLFGPVLQRGAAFDATSDRAWLQAMLDAEAALAHAQADLGFASTAQAAAVSACCQVERYDLDAIGLAARSGGNPVIPLVRALTAAVAAVDPEAATAVHRGATSQDIIDSAAMLVAGGALDAIEADLRVATRVCAALADTHRETPMAGRTLGQQAAPISFGFKAANWLVGLVAAGRHLTRLRTTRLAAQLGGAVGTLSVYGEGGVELLGAYARRLGLAEPVLAWHTERSRIAELGGMAALLAGAVGKVAGDIVLLSQSELAEVFDTAPARGGSSAMPHKRNPVAAIAARACAFSVPGPSATLLSSMAQEHERAAGAWHAEWQPLIDVLRSAGSAVAWLADALDHLDVDTEAMAANLGRSGGLLQAETVAAALAPTLGRLEAHALLERASRHAIERGVPLLEVLAEIDEVTAVLDASSLAALFDPRRALGSTHAFIERALADAQRW